jgi:hypothetical protein
MREIKNYETRQMKRFYHIIFVYIFVNGFVGCSNNSNSFYRKQLNPVLEYNLNWDEYNDKRNKEIRINRDTIIFHACTTHIQGEYEYKLRTNQDTLEIQEIYLRAMYLNKPYLTPYCVNFKIRNLRNKVYYLKYVFGIKKIEIQKK